MAKRRKLTPEEWAKDRAEHEDLQRRLRERIAYNEAKIAEERAREAARADRRRRLRRLVPFLRDAA